MMPAMSATLSALEGFGKKLAITADNIANVNTDGYRKKRALSQEGGPGGAAREGSNVALEEELPELVVTVYGFKANLKTLKAQDEQLGHLLDTVA